MKTACILQFFGLGDHIFTIAICRQLITEGYKVVYPVLAQYVEGNTLAYPDIRWVDHASYPAPYELKKDTEINGIRYIPLRWSMEITGTPYKDVMRSKYDMYGLDFTDWRYTAMWKRDPLRERELLKGLGVADGERFILVNQNYQSDFKGKAAIQVKTNHKVIQMTNIPGFSMFDWARVLEKAAEIHTVSTSLFFMLELLKLKNPIHLYPRNNDPDFRHISYLFTKPYILH